MLSSSPSRKCRQARSDSSRIYVPRGADPQALQTERRRFCDDAVMFTLSLLSRPWMDDPVPLNRDFQRELYGGKAWDDCRKAKLAAGWIAEAEGGSYTVGARSKVYRLGPTLAGRDLIPYVIRDPRVIFGSPGMRQSARRGRTGGRSATFWRIISTA
jgi:hypothetical protein